MGQYRNRCPSLLLESGFIGRSKQTGGKDVHPTRSLSDGSSFFWYRLKMTNPSESEIMSTTILVDVQLQRTETGEHDASLQELRQLIETLGGRIAGALIEKMWSLKGASLIGQGIVEEVS